jgi:tetraacyldisaccharide 4'-kinase
MNPLKTPSFWYRSLGIPAPFVENALRPLSALYGLFFDLHQRSKSPYKAEIPVVCLGNIVAGGTGKTPTALAIMDLICNSKCARNPYFLLRGYGGAEIGPLLVDPQIHSAWDVGDEALILARSAPTIIAADRAAGVKHAQMKGADLVLMDDGLQNPGIHKDLKFLVLNGEMGFGNQKLLPAGPLRQPLKDGLNTADAFILIGDDTRGIIQSLPQNKPLIKARIIQSNSATLDQNAPYIAFAGLGYPQKFFDFLKNAAHFNVVEALPYPDHFPYEEHHILKLKEKARALNARLITTEKDFMRIPNTVCGEIDVMPISIVFDAPQTLIDLIKTIEKQA